MRLKRLSVVNRCCERSALKIGATISSKLKLAMFFACSQVSSSYPLLFACDSITLASHRLASL